MLALGSIRAPRDRLQGRGRVVVCPLRHPLPFVVGVLRVGRGAELGRDDREPDRYLELADLDADLGVVVVSLGDVGGAVVIVVARNHFDFLLRKCFVPKFKNSEFFHKIFENDLNLTKRRRRRCVLQRLLVLQVERELNPQTTDFLFL